MLESAAKALLTQSAIAMILYWWQQAAQQDQVKEQYIRSVHNPVRKYLRAKQDLFWYQGIQMSHSMYNGLDPARICGIDEKFEQLAINYFDFFSRKNQLQAQQAQSARSFYENLYPTATVNS